MAHYRTHRHSSASSIRPLVVFLLIASFGILFAGCGGTEPSEIPKADSFTFTAEDLARMKEMMGQQPMIGGGSGSDLPYIVPLPEEAEPTEEIPVLDVRTQAKYAAVRSSGSEGGKDVYRVTNTFLNVRSAPKVTAQQTGRLEQGATVDVIEFTDAAWAKIKMTGDTEGYVSSRYISKVVAEDQLAAERKKYEGLYFVDFGFLNVRKAPDGDSDKIGELPGQTFVRPLSMDKVWARIPFGEGNGYVAAQYLSPFIPNFLVRQNAFTMPIIHYRLAEKGVLDRLPQHIAALQKEGYSFITVRTFAEALLEQQERDVRLPPKTVIIAISDVTSDSIKEVSDVLRVSGIPATLFVRTEEVGGSISQQNIQTLMANGFDLESSGHTGDDLRSLTNSQVELELAQSKKLLEDATKKQVYAIAYPVGGVNDRVSEKASDAGYLLGISAAMGTSFKRQDLLQMPNIVVQSSTTVDEVLTAVKGL